MGGHGGLNILPQKRWNVYNYENREKVRKDEEAAAREEQLRREQSRRRDSEFRLERLRRARGLPPAPAPDPAPDPAPAPVPVPDDSRHINLFDGLPGFSSLASAPNEKEKPEKIHGEDGGASNSRKRKREERPVAVGPEDEKYRLGYGLVGKGVSAPWYLSKPSMREDVDEENDGKGGSSSGGGSGKKSGGGKKTIEELREERMKREKLEKERERALLASAGKKGGDRGFSRRRM